MLCIIQPKACKRCGGDLSIECDVYGVYIECIQCGATWSRNDIKLSDIRQAVKNNNMTAGKSLTTSSPK